MTRAVAQDQQVKPAPRPGQVWEFSGDRFTQDHGVCLVLKANDRLVDDPGHECLILLDPGNHWNGEGGIVTLWLRSSNWEPLEP